MTEVILQAEKLCKHFRLADNSELIAVDEMDLSLYRGEVLGLVGESGSGKSTLGRLLSGLTDKTSGQVYLSAQQQPQRFTRKDFQRQALQLQMVFQDPMASLNPRMTVAEILAEPLILQDATVSKALLLAWLEKVNLPEQALDRYPHEFSGGQRQRLGIARALIAEPKVLICDEPISALDVSVQAQIVNLLSTLRSSMGLSILFIAHDLSMVRYISDRIAVMYRGQLMELATSQALFSQAQHPYTKLLLASNPVADPHLEQQRTVESSEVVVAGSEHQQAKGSGKARGCSFAGRCPYTLARCFSDRPALKLYADGHQVACHVVN